MPRKAKQARLLLRQRKGRQPVYVILDKGYERSTGFGPECSGLAEKALAEYISSKWEPPKNGNPDQFLIADVLTAYAIEHAPTTADPSRIGYAITALAKFWGDKTVSQVNAKNCRKYSGGRKVSDGTIRRELGCLNAAIQYSAKEGYINSAPSVTRPNKPPANDRWLTRNEIAKLIRAARKSGLSTHVAKFILVAIYTGTRKSAILNLEWEPNEKSGHIDVEKGIIYRSGTNERQTNKRRAPAKIPRQLLTHVRIWKKNSPRYVIHQNGHKVKDIKTAWSRICRDAKLQDVTRHTLKHTAITWAMQNGAKLADAASLFSTSLDTIERVYFHHHPDYQQSAVQALEKKPNSSTRVKSP